MNATSISNISLKVIDNYQGFYELKDKWNALAEENKSYLPWYCWEWFDNCIKYYDKNIKLHILTYYVNSKLIAIAPMMTEKDTYKKIIKVIRIKFIGNIHSLIKNIILIDNVDICYKDIFENMIYHLKYEWRKWDILEMDTLPVDDVLIRTYLASAINNKFKYSRYVCASNWICHTNYSNYDLYYEQMSKNIKRNIRRYDKSLNELGELNYRMVIDEDDIDRYLDYYDQTRQMSWKAPEKDKEFKRHFYKIAATKGWLRLSLLSLGDTPIAAAKYLVSNEMAFAIDAVYNEQYSKYSPGTVLTSRIFKHILDNDRVKIIDLGKGDESYKKEWAGALRKIEGITIYNNNARGRIVHAMREYIVPKLKRFM